MKYPGEPGSGELAGISQLLTDNTFVAMPLIIPFFIHHRGCPHRCLFCNQLSIGGRNSGDAADPAAAVGRTIEQWLDRSASNYDTVQVAFFGGSFTCLEEKLQHELLAAVDPFIRKGRVDSIRLSTRPDCLSDAICEFLVSAGVETVEIGAQSLNEQVLARAQRGHTAGDIERAVQLLAANGLQTGVQLMAGLPGETTRSFMDGIKRVVELSPDLVRIYPTLVLKDTELANLYQQSSWRPLSLERAVSLCTWAYDLLAANSIKVIRMGLQPGAELEKQLIAGPYHPAFGELVISRSWYLKIRRLLLHAGVGRVLTLTVSTKDVSALIGDKRKNIQRLENLAYGARLQVATDAALSRGQFHYAVS